jgi:hypothetical protein
MMANREFLLIVAVSVLSVAALSILVVLIAWYIAYIHATKAYIGSGDYEAWREFVRRASSRIGLVVFALTFLGAQAGVLVFLVYSESQLTPSALAIGITSGTVISLLLTTLFLKATRWNVLRDGESVIQSIAAESKTPPTQLPED